MALTLGRLNNASECNASFFRRNGYFIMRFGFGQCLSDATKTDAAQLASILVRRRRSELAMTLTEDNAIAAAAIVGERSRPKAG